MPYAQALKARLDECDLEQCKAVARYISMKTFIVVARHRDISTALQVRPFLDLLTCKLMRLPHCQEHSDGMLLQAVALTLSTILWQSQMAAACSASAGCHSRFPSKPLAAQLIASLLSGLRQRVCWIGIE